jgi:hypothetical protein
MQGEINVAEIMDRAQRLKVWYARQQRSSEWEALKQYWRADRRVRQARSEPERHQARLDRARTVWLYRAELKRAWPKWQRARAAQRGGRWFWAEADQP